MRKVKVSAKCANLKFHGCTPEFIAETCKASCCRRAGNQPALISIAPSEIESITALGGTVENGKLTTGNRCTFQNRETELCDIHFTGSKPFGCIASPFTLNRGHTLIVRHRYISLKCYNQGPRLPAYKAFRASLDLIFGDKQAQNICNHFDQGGGDKIAAITDQTWDTLKGNDQTKRST